MKRAFEQLRRGLSWRLLGEFEFGEDYLMSNGYFGLKLFRHFDQLLAGQTGWFAACTAKTSLVCTATSSFTDLNYSASSSLLR